MSEPSTNPTEQGEVVPTEQELRRLIKCLRPDREVYSGRKFFERLMEYKGPEGVLDFIRRASSAMLTQDGLDLHYNFDEVETEIFKKTYLKVWSRREFLNTVGWGVPGAVFTGYGLGGMAEQLDDYCTRGSVLPADWKQSRWPRKVKEVMLIPEPAAEVLVGAALINESFEKWEEIKLEQIADAVDVLGQKLRISGQLDRSQGQLSR